MRVKFDCEYEYGNFIISNYLKENKKVELVKTNEQLYINLNDDSTNYLKSNFVILVCGESLFSKYNLLLLIKSLNRKTPSFLDLNFLSFICIYLKIEIKYKNICPRHIRDFMKSLPKKNKYAIITNKYNNPNVFSLPFFMLLNYHKILQNHNKKLNLKNKKFCCIIVSNLASMDRITFTRKLSKYKKVDIYGKTFLTNSDNSKLPKKWSDNPSFYNQYKFVISFENSYDDGYLTEKLPNAILGNTIPIYRGATNVDYYFNTKSFINYYDYNRSYSKMIKKIIELDKDDKKYEDFFYQPNLTEKNIAHIKDKEKKFFNFLDKIINI